MRGLHLTSTILLGVVLVVGSGCSRPTPQGESTSAPTTTSMSPQHCPPKDGRTIDISVGSISCDQAYSTVAGYDWQGQKYQQIAGFTCYTGTAQTAPVVLVCSSDGVEFTVSESAAG